MNSIHLQIVAGCEHVEFGSYYSRGNRICHQLALTRKHRHEFSAALCGGLERRCLIYLTFGYIYYWQAGRANTNGGEVFE
jgi:hypothetical protein